jgi:glucan phosphorylase
LGAAVGTVTLASNKGYLSQRLDEEGNQTELPIEWRIDDFTTLMAPKVSVAIEGREVKMASLRPNLPSANFIYCNTLSDILMEELLG